MNALVRPLRSSLRRAGWPHVKAATCEGRHVATTGRSYDVVIIGAGVIGSACAFELRKLGLTTLNLDSNPSPGYGSTSSSSAVVRHFYSLEETARLAWEGYHCWKAWADHLEAPPGDELCHLWEVGCAALDSPKSPGCQTYLSKVRKAMEACSIPVEYWDEPELRRRIPYMSTASYHPPRRIDDDTFGEDNGGLLSGLLFCPQAGYVNDPQLAARNLADAATRLGAEFRWRSRVTQILRDPTGTSIKGVRLEDGSEVHSQVVVNVAGPASNIIQRMAFDGAAVADDSKVTTRPLRVEVAYLPEPPGSNVDSTLPVVADLDAGVYFRPQQGGTLLVGSAEPECDELHFLSSEDEFHDGLTEDWTNYAYRAALRFPDLQVPNSATGLTSMYDNTPDWVPIYDKSALSGYYMMCGTSGNQFKTAPVVGRICSRLVESCQNGHDHDAEPLDLAMLHAGGSVKLGNFSRLRSQAETSGTVFG